MNAGQDGHPSLEQAMQASMQQIHQEDDAPAELPKYNIVDAIQSSSIFRDSYAVMVYDNIADDFLMLYSSDEGATPACKKLRQGFVDFIYLLRKTFPERFCGKDCDELAIPISSGDYPHLKGDTGCFDNFPQAGPSCTTETPILQFGSVFKSFQGLPHMQAMPMPVLNGLMCFKEWVEREKSKVCYSMSSSTSSIADQQSERSLHPYANYRQVFNDGVDSKSWDELVPQVIWRGSNFQYMGLTQNGLRKPSLNKDIPAAELAKVQDATERRKAAALALGRKYDQFLPRWKGVILSAHAEIDAEEGMVPWADMKFSGGINKDFDLNEKLMDYGVSVEGEMMSPQQMADYRYQIDIGGGGGTTWTGTTQKMAMPGLLFHHTTVTKDYIHDRMKPYIHYVPVKADLSDLKEKYDWAEANPTAAKLIADQGTQLMRHIGTVDGFSELFDGHFAEPVRRVIDAYQSVSAMHPGISWRELIEQTDGLPDFVIRTKPVCRGGRIVEK